MIVGHGRLRHCFFGDYSAVIGLKFDSRAIALQVLLLPGFEQWELFDDTGIIRWSGSEVEAQERMLETYGADRNKIGSLAKSIDYGEPFTVHISQDTAQPDNLIQEALF